MTQKQPTLRDVAKFAGVSKATAARVVNGANDLVREETRQRVISAIKELGYERHAIAGSLRSDRTYMLALSIPDITNPFWPEVARGVQDTVEQAGYTVVLMNNDWDTTREQKHLRKMQQKQFDGLIINPTGTLYTDLIKLSIPVVLLASGDGYPEYDTVSSDSVQAGHLLMQHLLELGHRQIALIAGPLRRQKSHTHQDTYLKVCREHGLPIHSDYMVETTFTQQGGYQAMQQLLALPEPPTAVFAVNDIIALGAMQAAQSAGWQIPGQISIIGMDDIFAAVTSYPPLTTVAKPKYEIGVTAAQLMLARIQNSENAPIHALLPCKLVQRNSTARPR